MSVLQLTSYNIDWATVDRYILWPKDECDPNNISKINFK